MSTVGTFGGFTAARLGIYASQKALEVTGNNISNINTPGYTRQRLDQISFNVGASDRYHAKYNTQVGQGTLTVSVSQLRDPYLDIRYRAESATLGYTETTQSWLSDVQTILDEVGDGDDEHGLIYAQLEQIEKALLNHSDHAGEKEYNTQVRNACESLVFQINEAARKLNTTRDNAVASLEEQVSGVNEILTQIRDLNILIRKSDIHGDNALEMRDKRNTLIDQLSTYMDVDVIYTEESFGPGDMVEKLTIKLGNANPDPAVSSDEALLVDGAYCTQFSIDKTPDLNPEFITYDRQDWYEELAADPANEADLNALDEQVKTMKEAYEALNKYLEDPRNLDDEGKLTDKAEANPKYGALNDDVTNAQNIVMDSLTALEGKGVDINISINDSGDICLNDAPNKEKFRYLNRKGGPVETRGEAEKVYDEYYRLTISELRDKNDKILQLKKDNGDGGFYYRDSEPISLDDNDLYGALQALREFLTEEGEFASKDEIEKLDGNAATKRGIPYFQKSLDLLARKFAETFNEANQNFLCNEKGDYIDQDGNVLDCPKFEDGKPVYLEDVNHNTIYKDANGNEYTLNTTPNTYKDKNNHLYTFDSEKETMTPQAGGATAEPITVSGAIDPDKKTTLNKYAVLTDEQKEWLAKEAAKGVDENGNRKVDADGNPVTGYPVAVGGVLFSNSGDSDDDSYITAENISISISWASEATKIVRSFVQPAKLANMEEGTQGTEGKEGEDSVASTDNRNILHMVSLLDKTMTYNPQDWTDAYGNSGKASSPVLVKADFNEMVNNMSSVLGNDMRKANLKYDESNVALNDLDMARDSVSAVDLNDEAMNLMQFSKSYSAACRLMTTLDDVLDRLINNTGVTR